jgi:hypothetical protein
MNETRKHVYGFDDPALADWVLWLRWWKGSQDRGMPANALRPAFLDGWAAGWRQGLETREGRDK